MIQKMSDQNKIKFIDVSGFNENIISATKSDVSKNENITEDQKSRKINNKDNGMMTSKHVSSAYTGNISDKGGSSKQIKFESSNTIWESNKISSLSEDSKTRVKKEKEQMASNKRLAEQNRMDDIVEKLRDTDQRKSSSIHQIGLEKGANYNTSKNHMSIFDTEDFQRLAEKTDGEKVSEDKEKRMSQKDNSWRGDKKAISTRDKLNSFIDNLLEGMGS